MFSSKWHLSSKGPLGAIWVAAYFLKKLNKSQVQETDISSSVDKILQYEIGVVTYRVLAYLLLGVVRIYSIKANYLLNDCHEVLRKINEMLVNEKSIALKDTSRTPYYSITVPEKFELDAFDLEIFEDVSEGHIRPHEEITLEDNNWKNERMEQYILDESRSEQVATIHDTYFTHHIPAEEMDINLMEVSTSHDVKELESVSEKLQEHMFPQEDSMIHETFGIGEEPPGTVDLFCKEHQIDVENVYVQKLAVLEKECTEKLKDNSTHSQEECENLEMFHGVEGKSQDPTKLWDQDHQINGEEKVSEDGIEKVSEDDHDRSNLQVIMEKLRGSKFSQKKCTDVEEVMEGPSELVERYDEEHHIGVSQPKRMEVTMSKNKRHQAKTDRPLSITFDATPQSKFRNASGASSGEFLGTSTPATKDHARNLRKRKCFVDDLIVLPNEVLRQSIHDTSDLVAKRRKVQNNSRAAWISRKVPSFLPDFMEPLLPCIASELQLLWKNKLKIPPFGYLKTLENVPEIIKKVESPEMSAEIFGIANAHEKFPELLETRERPETIRGSVSTADVPVKLPESVEPPEHLETLREYDRAAEAPENIWIPEGPEKLDGSDSPTVVRSLEETEIAPETPVHYSTFSRLLQSPTSIPCDRVIPGTTFGSIEGDSYLDNDHEFDLDLMEEDFITCGDSQELNGCSGRTRIVATYLHRSLLNQHKGKGKQIVGLFSVLKGRTKKESARIFYEILVLKSKGYIDVKQDKAYGDIRIYNSPKDTKLDEMKLDCQKL